MNVALRLVVGISVVALLAGCSSDGSSGASGGSGGAGTGSGGSSSASGGSSSASGGSSVASSGGSGGTVAQTCGLDGGTNNCLQCLSQQCCDMGGPECFGDPSCLAALMAQQHCREAPGAETSDCFGTLMRTLQGDSGATPPIVACIISNCSATCGGPGVV